MDLRASLSDSDNVGAFKLAGNTVPETEGFVPLEVMQEGQVLRVRVPEFVPEDDRFLWVHRQPPIHLLIRLRDEIAAMAEPGLAHDLAMGHLSSSPPQIDRIAGFTPAQTEAFTACLSPGVRLIWGPPGTGKTRVLTEAIGRLRKDGKRVLLVSSTNIAVDNALAGVSRLREHQPGELVRVGPPHLREIADDKTVALAHLTTARLAEVTAERERLQHELLVIKRNAAAAAAAEKAVEDFDFFEYERLRTLMDNAAKIPSLAAEAEKAAQLVSVRTERHGRHRRVLAAAHAAWQETAEDRHAHAEIDRIRRALADANAATARVGVRLVSARETLTGLETQLHELKSQPFLKRLSSRHGLRKTQSAVAEARSRAAAWEAQLRESRELLDAFVGTSEAEIQRLLASIKHDLEEIARREQAVMAAGAGVGQAESALRFAAEVNAKAQAALAAAEKLPQPGPEEVEWVRLVQRMDLPSAYRRARQLREMVQRDAPRRADLEKRYASIQDRFERLRRDAEGEVIRSARVVAATLARLRTNKDVLKGPYDVVLVDEVGAATIPEVLLAVSRAAFGAVLLGDFMQLGAVLPRSVADSPRPDVKRWLRQDVFALCGITGAQQALTRSGCITLNMQYRFGMDVLTLANEIAYGGMLKPGRVMRERDALEDPEIVLINTDNLGDLGVVRATTGMMKGWWPAGALLSRVLSEHHHAQGEDVGVVTPYREQVEATLEALRDIEGSVGLTAEVGTAHRFQGREFSIVIFDMVEDGFADRWMARAGLTDDFARDGLRLFNVAVTRTKTRLYMIASRAKIERARPGTPLGQLAARLGKRIRTLPAEHLVAATVLEQQLEVPLGPFGRELAEVLARHVRVAGIDDERQFYATFAEHLAAARESVWIWAPWTAKRLRNVLPLLSDAAGRGVRITVFVRDSKDKMQERQLAQALLQDLRSTVQCVVEIHDMHQKIVVIDQHTVLLGSLNALSHAVTREVMLVMQGHHFARKLLEHERAEHLAQPAPPCGKCGTSTKLDVRRNAKGHWYWRCYAPATTGRSCGWVKTLPDRHVRRTG